MSIIRAAAGAAIQRRPYGMVMALLFVLAVIMAVLILAAAVGPAGGLLSIGWM
jgi:hypothetical protein